MYLKHFGLSQWPFNITPDPKMFYPGANRGAIREALSYIIRRGEGITKVVGEVGSGKTMLSRMLANALPERIDIVYVTNPKLTPGGIFKLLASELGLSPVSEDHNDLIHQLQHELILRHGKGHQVVVFIDEAQAMPLQTLEEIRLLSNLETADHKLLQIVLFGQPELDRELDNAEIRQIRERITNNLELQPFGAEDIQAYLDFRLRKVGYAGPPLFDAAASKAIHKHSLGLIRRINVLADKTLTAAFAAGEYQISNKHLETAIQDSGYAPAKRRFDFNFRIKPVWAAAASVAALGLALATGVQLRGADSEPLAQTQPEARPSQPVEAPVVVKEVHKTQPAVAETPAEVPAKEAPKLSGEPAKAADGTLAQRIEATQAAFAGEQGSGYTIQLMTVAGNRSDSVQKTLVRHSGNLDDNSLFVYPFKRNGQDYLSVAYGQFKTTSEARAAMTTLPDEFQAEQPFVRTYAGIRKEGRSALTDMALASTATTR